MSDSNILLPPVPEHPLIEAPGEEKLRQEVETLRHQLEQERKRNQKEQNEPKRPSRRNLWIIGLIIAGILVIALVAGFLPYLRRQRQLRQDANAEAKAMPVIAYVDAQRSPDQAHLVLPGSMEAITESPVLARADGYLKKRYADIGDRVKEGQLLAEITAPDLDQQVQQARAQLLQTRAALRQSTAAVGQAQANQSLSKVTAERWANLLRRGAVAPQDNDTRQADYVAQTNNVSAMQEAESAARQNVSSAQANLDRLIELQGYEQVRAPFTGVVTLRNVDTGALIMNGQTLLYRVAQTDVLRTYIYSPEWTGFAAQVGQTAKLTVAEYPGEQFAGRITRTSVALDPSTRTLVIEVQVVNKTGRLLPGMFAQVTLDQTRPNPPILIPADALIIRSDGAFAAVLEGSGPEVEAPEDESQGGGSGQQQKGTGQKGKQSKGKNKASTKPEKNDRKDKERVQKQQQQLPTFTVHLVPVAIGRDYGNAVEILTGLKGGEHIVESPNDFIQEGAQVKGEKSKENPVTSAGASSSKQSQNSETLMPQPGAEPSPEQPAKEQMNRGPLQ